MLGRSVLFLILSGILLSPLAAESSSPQDTGNPMALYPSSIGYSFSEVAGKGFLYRFLDDREGWQISAAVTNHHNTIEKLDYYSIGVAKDFAILSFVPVSWFYSQLYWLIGASWQSESGMEWVEVSFITVPEGRITVVDGPHKPWAHIAAAGPALGLELGLFQHFSLNLELQYKVGYNVSQSDASKALIIAPSLSSNFLFRF